MNRKMTLLTMALTITLLPAATLADCGSPHGTSAKAASMKPDIVDTAVAAGSFQTLAAALQAAGLVDALKGEGPFTVFAPTDEAFARLPKGTVEELLKPENKDKLVSILSYHVVPGELDAAQVIKLKQAKALSGESLSIRVEKEEVRIQDAKVTQADIVCGNGIIHVIDTVLLPN
jgi:uncharacterized surface protein with fasciclin (FAS1) repeats